MNVVGKRVGFAMGTKEELEELKKKWKVQKVNMYVNENGTLLIVPVEEDKREDIRGDMFLEGIGVPFEKLI